MVGKKPNLWKFLKKEVQKGKIKEAESGPLRHPATSNSGGRNPLTQENLFGFGSGIPLNSMKLNSWNNSPSPSMRTGSGDKSLTQDHLVGFGGPLDSMKLKLWSVEGLKSLFRDHDVDSIFGEPLGTPLVKDQELQAQLEQLLVERTPRTPVARFTESNDLRNLKDELKKLIFFETDGKLTGREWVLLERQKDPLIEEIRYIGEVERMNFEENRAKKNQSREFPEPIGHSEKIRMERDMKRLETAKAKTEGASRRSQKRTRDERDNDNDLDGEERLRLGKPIKRNPKLLETTGHFKSTRHDYFPGLPGAKKIITQSGAKATTGRTLRDYGSEERKLRRRELAELGDALAKADRRMKGYGR